MGVYTEPICPVLIRSIYTTLQKDKEDMAVDIDTVTSLLLPSFLAECVSGAIEDNSPFDEKWKRLAEWAISGSETGEYDKLRKPIMSAVDHLFRRGRLSESVNPESWKWFVDLASRTHMKNLNTFNPSNMEQSHIEPVQSIREEGYHVMH